MGKDANLGVVVEAKAQYTNELVKILKDHIFERFMEMYESARTQARYKTQAMMDFQKRLREIPDWNEIRVDSEVSSIKDKCGWIEDLLAAIFVANIKVLSSVKVGDTKKKLKVKMPTAEKFIHSVFWNCAETIYNECKDNALFSHGKVHSNRDLIISHIERSIEDTVDKLIPYQNILQMYLGESLRGDEIPNDESDDDIDDENNIASDDDNDDTVPEEAPQPEMPKPQDLTDTTDFFHKPQEPPPPEQDETREDLCETRDIHVRPKGTTDMQEEP